MPHDLPADAADDTAEPPIVPMHGDQTRPGRKTGHPGNQAEFTSALFQPTGDIPDMLRKRANGAPAQKRFDIYRNNVVASLVGVLEAGFSVTRALVGEEFFRAMAAEFARHNRPKTPVLFEYGAAFPDFIARFPPAQSVPGLADCAAIEQARREVYHAADAESLASEKLASVPGDELPCCTLVLHSALRLLRLQSPAATVWQRHQHAPAPDLTGLPDQGEDVLVFRQGVEVLVRNLAAGQYFFLRSLAEGRDLQSSASIALADNPTFDLQAAISLLLETGILVSIVSPGAD